MLLLLVVLTLFLTFPPELLTPKEKVVYNHKSPFESGFDPDPQKKNFFSMHYFIVCIIFLIFDLEVVLVVPIIGNSVFCFWLYPSLVTVFFVFLLVTTLLEWWGGFLTWLD